MFRGEGRVAERSSEPCGERGLDQASAQQGNPLGRSAKFQLNSMPKEYRIRLLWPFFQRNPGRGILGSDVFGARADEAIVVELLDDVRGPSGDAAHREDRRVEVDVDAQRLRRSRPSRSRRWR